MSLEPAFRISGDGRCNEYWDYFFNQLDIKVVLTGPGWHEPFFSIFRLSGDSKTCYSQIPQAKHV